MQVQRLTAIGARCPTGAGLYQGGWAAWEELVRRNARRVFNLCYRFTGNATDADDLSQEVFLRIYRRSRATVASYGAFPTWLTSVTRNLLVDHYRRTKHDRLTDSIDDENAPQLEEKPSTGRTPDKIAEAGELSAQIQEGLAQLSPELREAVILRDLQGLEYARDSGGAASAGGHGEVENQSRKN